MKNLGDEFAAGGLNPGPPGGAGTETSAPDLHTMRAALLDVVSSVFRLCRPGREKVHLLTAGCSISSVSAPMIMGVHVASPISGLAAFGFGFGLHLIFRWHQNQAQLAEREEEAIRRIVLDLEKVLVAVHGPAANDNFRPSDVNRVSKHARDEVDKESPGSSGQSRY